MTITTRNGCTATLTPASLPANQRLWVVRHGAVVLHRVTSKATRLTAETFIFPADPTGRVTRWHELSGSCSGERSHEDAIASHLDTLC